MLYDTGAVVPEPNMWATIWLTAHINHNLLYYVVLATCQISLSQTIKFQVTPTTSHQLQERDQPLGLSSFTVDGTDIEEVCPREPNQLRHDSHAYKTSMDWHRIGRGRAQRDSPILGW